MLSTAATTADDLVATGATVRDIETAIGTDGERTTVDLDTLVRSAVDDASADADAVAVSVPEGLTVAAEPDVLALILAEIVENALAHGDDPVSVAVDRTAEGVEVVVADAGPGIPDHELSPLRSGTETDLDHGSGLGLWVVQWGVDRLGGTVAFDTGDDGTTVSLTLPAT
nr:HAMP domain-containing sensor histidine kinase [Halapricum sp. CBA1109]